MQLSPMMIKALFSTLGLTPEQVMEPILTAIKDIEEFKCAIIRIENRLANIEDHFNIASIDPVIPSEILIEGKTDAEREHAN